MAAIYLGAAVGSPRVGRAEEPAVDIDAAERVPMALVINSPMKGIASTSRSEINRIAAEVLKEHTNLRTDLAEDAPLQDCAGKLSCIVERVRSDYRRTDWTREDNPQRLRSFSEVRGKLASAKPLPPKYLVTLDVTPYQGGDRVIPNLFDTDDALGYIHEAYDRESDAPQLKDELDGKIAQFSVRVSLPPSVVSPGEIEAFLKKLLLEDFRPELEKSGYWDPYGLIAVEIAQPGFEIELDGRRIGATKAGRTVIRALAGDHTLRLLHPDFVPIERPVKVERGKTTTVSTTAEHPRNPVARGLRAGAFWGGIALAVAGVALVGLAAQRAGNVSRSSTCIHVDPGARPCDGSAALRFGADDSSPAIQRDPNGGGLPIVPLGIGVAGMGGTWAIGTALAGDSDSYPVLEVGLGVVVLIASLLISAKADGKTACKDGGCWK